MTAAPPATRNAHLEAALTIARELVSEAIETRDGLTWTAEIAVGMGETLPILGHGDVGPVLYDGVAGIGLALAAAAAATRVDDGQDEYRFAAGARGALRTALVASGRLLEDGRFGLFDGTAGIALAAVTGGRLIHDDHLVRDGVSLARSTAQGLTDLVDDNASLPELDVIGGIAGAALGLLATAAMTGDAALASSGDAVAATLTAAAVPQTWGAAWMTGAAQADGPPLLGLGHGAAGIALSIAELSAGRSGATAAAWLAGAEYERGWFDAERVAWPDLRHAGPDGEPSGWMAAWCHGAIGIGISRVRLATLTSDPLAVVEASAALQAARDNAVAAGTELRHGRPTDCSPCHGLAGVAELLLIASRGLAVDDHARAARRIADLMLEEHELGSVWPCGLPGAGQVPGLMTGTAGIALTLLRVSGAVTVASPLLPGPAGW
jgi:lantibiotic biosynthesis protein